MGDGEALLRAILDQPKEETPRLVYADWLEENGQPERAEFIRVQVELARMPGCIYPKTGSETCQEWNRSGRVFRHWCQSCEKGNELRRREGELFRDHIEHQLPESLGAYLTLGELLVANGQPGARLTRGFVSHVSCSWPDWRTHADAILAAQPVERVRLTTRPDADEWEGRGHFRLDPFRLVVPDEGEPYYHHGRWPRIKFELPPVPGESLREWWENHTQAHTQ
jgi:uncharacterized protein (TIGR02996 family)